MLTAKGPERKLLFAVTPRHLTSIAENYKSLRTLRHISSQVVTNPLLLVQKDKELFGH